MFFRRRREKKRAEEQQARDALERMRERSQNLERQLEMRKVRLAQRSRERELYGDSSEQAYKYEAVAKDLFELVSRLICSFDTLAESQKIDIIGEVKRVGNQLNEEGGLPLMEVVCGRVAELGYAEREGILTSVGRTLEEEWKFIGEWR